MYMKQILLIGNLMN